MMFKNKSLKQLKDEDEEINKLEKEFNELINKSKPQNNNKIGWEQRIVDWEQRVKKMNANFEKDFKEFEEQEYKKYYRTFKEGVRRPDAKVSKSVKKYFNKYKSKLLDESLTIQKLIELYQHKYRRNKSFVNGYLYVDAERDEEGHYKKDYNYGNPHIIQWDISKTTKYTIALELNLVLKNNLIGEYEVSRFYNVKDDGKPIIDKFVKLMSDNDEDLKVSINRIEISKDITGFKIVSIKNMNQQYKKPNLVNDELKEDDANKAVNTKYTNYMIDMMSSDLKNIVKLNYNQYIQENFRPNSCVLTAIINKYYDRFNKRKPNGSRIYKELTYDYLCEVLDLESKPDNIGCSIERAVEKFFKRFEFTGIYVYDSFMNLEFSHISNPKNKDLSTMRVLVKDGHLYELNDNINKLKQITNGSDDEKQEIIVNNKYNIMTFKNEMKEFFAETETEIIRILKEEVPKEEVKEIKIICQVSLKEILFKLVEGGYTPKVGFDVALYKIGLYLNNTMIQIIQANNNPVYGQLINYKNLQEYQEYEKAYEVFYGSIVKKEYLSDYHPSVIQVDNYYKINNVCGYFFDWIDYHPFDGLDENKAYTECLMKIKEIPIFNYFDVYQPYNNEPIEDLSQYIIEVFTFTQRTSIVFSERFTKTFGYVLKEIAKFTDKKEIKFKILYVRKPLNTEDVNFQKPVQELFNNKNITMQMKKSISNITTGLLEKKINKGELSKIFKDFNEAFMYSEKYNGKLLIVSKDYNDQVVDYKDMDFQGIDPKDVDNKYLRVISEFGDEIIVEKEKKDQNEIQDDQTLYLVKITEQKELQNGFLPIKEMIYLNQRLKLLNQYDKMMKLGLIVRGIKTDCVFYNRMKSGNADEVIAQNFNLSTEIGEFKIERQKYLPQTKLEVKKNCLMKIPLFDEIHLKTFQDEYDTKVINEYLNGHKRVLIKGLFAGVGKSTIAKNYDNGALFNCPYNTLCQQLRIDNFKAITYSKLFGLVGSDEEMKTIQRYNIEDYKTIVFDEIFLYEPKRLKRISELMEQYPEKNFIATGDCDQRAPVGFNNSEYLTSCMNILFKDQILLQEIKRLDKEEDKQKMKELKKDIFNTSFSIESICDKYGLKKTSSMNEVNTKLNICLFNFRCDMVNERIHSKVFHKTTKFEVGQEIICKKYERKNRLITNYKYKITKMKKNDVVIRDEVDEIDYKITPQILLNHFKLPYAVTCDSVQGITRNEPITIFDSNTPYVDRKFLWTALTRVKKLEDITIFIHSKEDVERLTTSRLNLYLKQKVDCYKSQDRKAEREYVEDDFVDVKWINEKFEASKYCLFCKKHYELYLDQDSNVISNITVDRINNKLAHTKNNCQLCCHHCNITKGNRY